MKYLRAVCCWLTRVKVCVHVECADPCVLCLAACVDAFLLVHRQPVVAARVERVVVMTTLSAVHRQQCCAPMSPNLHKYQHRLYVYKRSNTFYLRIDSTTLRWDGHFVWTWSLYRSLSGCIFTTISYQLVQTSLSDLPCFTSWVKHSLYLAWVSSDVCFRNNK